MGAFWAGSSKGPGVEPAWCVGGAARRLAWPERSEPQGEGRAEDREQTKGSRGHGERLALLCWRQELGEALSRGHMGPDLGLSLAKVWGPQRQE